MSQQRQLSDLSWWQRMSLRMPFPPATMLGIAAAVLLAIGWAVLAVTRPEVMLGSAACAAQYSQARNASDTSRIDAVRPLNTNVKGRIANTCGELRQRAASQGRE